MYKNKESGAFTQSIIIKHSSNENVTPIDIWHRLNVQFGNNTLLTYQADEWHKLLKMAL